MREFNNAIWLHDGAELHPDEWRRPFAGREALDCSPNKALRWWQYAILGAIGGLIAIALKAVFA